MRSGSPRPALRSASDSSFRNALLYAPVLAALISAAAFSGAFSCTNMLVTRGASADGSVMITYTCDGEFHPRMTYTPPADYEPGDSLELRGWDGRLRGKIAQPAHTYGVVHLMNEKQLVIGETCLLYTSDAADE